MVDQMKEKSEMERIFEAYLRRDDAVISIGSKEYYRIVHKDCLAAGGGMTLITIPNKLLCHSTSECTVLDENGRTLRLGPSVHYSFIGDIPAWYLETTTVIVPEIKGPDQVGDYLTLL